LGVRNVEIPGTVKNQTVWAGKSRRRGRPTIAARDGRSSRKWLSRVYGCVRGRVDLENHAEVAARDVQIAAAIFSNTLQPPESNLQCIDRLLKRNSTGNRFDNATGCSATGVIWPQTCRAASRQLSLYLLTPCLPRLGVAAGWEGIAEGACGHALIHLAACGSNLTKCSLKYRRKRGAGHRKEKQNASKCHGWGLEQGTAGHLG
jgi:hypothetical protein